MGRKTTINYRVSFVRACQAFQQQKHEKRIKLSSFLNKSRTGVPSGTGEGGVPLALGWPRAGRDAGPSLPPSAHPPGLGLKSSSGSAAAARGSEGLGPRPRCPPLGPGGSSAHGSALGSPRPGPALLLHFLLSGGPASRAGSSPCSASSHCPGPHSGRGCGAHPAIPSPRRCVERPSGGRRRAARAAVPAPRALRPTSRAAAPRLSPPASPGAVPDPPGSERPASLGARRRRAEGTERSGRGGRGPGLGAPRALRRWLLRRRGRCAFAPDASCSLSSDSCCLCAAPSTWTWTVLPSTPAPREVTSASRWISSCPARLRKWPHLEGESASSPTARTHPASPHWERSLGEIRGSVCLSP